MELEKNPYQQTDVILVSKDPELLPQQGAVVEYPEPLQVEVNYGPTTEPTPSKDHAITRGAPDDQLQLREAEAENIRQLLRNLRMKLAATPMDATLNTFHERQGIESQIVALEQALGMNVRIETID